LHIFRRDFDAFERGGKLIFQTAAQQIELPLPRLHGRHQIDNAGAAIATANIMFGSESTNEALERGLTQAVWPARLERLPPGALYNYVREGSEIWLDGGHNPGGAQAIARALAEMRQQQPGPVHLIWGMMETKDAQAVIAPFKGLVDRIYTVPIPGEPNAFSASSLMKIAANEGFKAAMTSGVRHALLQSRTASSRPKRVLICGSLYLAGHVLKLHGG
jgi:dihydrofolate synthase/folylpolyglutamate synthase